MGSPAWQNWSSLWESWFGCPVIPPAEERDLRLWDRLLPGFWTMWNCSRQGDFVVPSRSQANWFPHLLCKAHRFGDALGVVLVRTHFQVRRISRGSLRLGAVRNESLGHHLIWISSSKTRKGLQEKGCIYNPGSASTEAEFRQRVIVCQGSLVLCP